MPKLTLDSVAPQISKIIEAISIPPLDAAKCDLRYQIREWRLQLQRQVEELQKIETALNNHFIETLPLSQASGVAGHVARIQIQTKIVPQAADWALIWEHVRKTRSYDLLQRRLNNAAVEERWQDGKVIPGVETFHAKTVSCTKL
jgi:hypothetical protein